MTNDTTNTNIVRYPLPELALLAWFEVSDPVADYEVIRNQPQSMTAAVWNRLLERNNRSEDRKRLAEHAVTPERVDQLLDGEKRGSVIGWVLQGAPGLTQSQLVALARDPKLTASSQVRDVFAKALIWNRQWLRDGMSPEEFELLHDVAGAATSLALLVERDASADEILSCFPGDGKWKSDLVSDQTARGIGDSGSVRSLGDASLAWIANQHPEVRERWVNEGDPVDTAILFAANPLLSAAQLDRIGRVLLDEMEMASTAERTTARQKSAVWSSVRFLWNTGLPTDAAEMFLSEFMEKAWELGRLMPKAAEAIHGVHRQPWHHRVIDGQLRSKDGRDVSAFIKWALSKPAARLPFLAVLNRDDQELMESLREHGRDLRVHRSDGVYGGWNPALERSAAAAMELFSQLGIDAGNLEQIPTDMVPAHLRRIAAVSGGELDAKDRPRPHRDVADYLPRDQADVDPDAACRRFWEAEAARENGALHDLKDKVGGFHHGTIPFRSLSQPVKQRLLNLSQGQWATLFALMASADNQDDLGELVAVVETVA